MPPNIENELTQKPPKPLNSPKIGSAFVVSSIFLLAFNTLVALEAVHHAIPQLSKQYRL